MSLHSGNVIFEGSSKEKLPGFDLLPSIDDHDVFSITVRTRRKLPLPDWTGKRLTHGQLARRHGAHNTSLVQVGSFASENRLKVVRAHTGNREVIISGTARDMQRTFDVDLRVSRINGRLCRVRQGSITVPRELAPIISSVIGLDNRPFAKPHYRFSTRTAHTTGAGILPMASLNDSHSPIEIASLYNFPKSADGTGQTIAVLELDGGFRQAELATYFQELGIRQAPSIAEVTFPGSGSNNPGVDALDPFCRDVEVMLDLQIAGAMAPGAGILVYFALDSSDQHFLAAMSAIIHDSTRKPDIISLSWGGPELTATAQFRDEFDELLKAAAHLGITVCVATGDNASPDFASDDPRWDHGAHCDFPASSPWALACGGTQIAVSNGSITNETVWFDEPNNGTGGGVSRVFSAPEYQKAVTIPRACDPDGPVMRGIPDVAANAAPASGYKILCNGQNFPDSTKNVLAMGGTSASSPFWAALIARINQSLGHRCGFINPLLYQAARLPGFEVFRNPLSGTNGSYVAGPGWNACTGLGSVDGTQLLGAIKALQIRNEFQS